MNGRSLLAGLGCSSLVLFGVAACGRQGSPSRVELDEVAPVAGPSLLTRLGLDVDGTRLGRVGGDGAAPDRSREEILPPPVGGLRRLFRRLSEAGETPQPSFTLTGEDLYRLNCQACHGPDGAGAPPEINTLIDPVRGTSAALLRARLEAAGRPVDEEFIGEVTAGARSDLRQRLLDGGEKMPPFAMLHRDELDALVDYLGALAGLPDAPARQPAVTESDLHVGEQLVKGTCQICHDASGPDPGRMGVMMGGKTPPLSSLTGDYSVDEVVAKVRDGRSATGGMMRTMREPKMPRLPFLTREEVTAAYRYLAALPPRF